MKERFQPTIRLDKLDRKVLYALDQNSRISVSDLARNLHQGRDRIAYRIERLIEQKVIRRFTTSINLHKLGFTIFKSYLRLETTKSRVSEFVTYLRDHPRVYWIALCDGGWDLMIAVFARDAKEFHSTLSEIVTAYNEIILNFGIYTLVELRMFEKGFFIEKGGGFFTVGGNPEVTTIDSIDYEILKALSNDSRKSVVELAKNVKTTPGIVNYRINQLEKQGIITGYGIEVDLQQLQMLFFKTQLFLRNYTSTLREKFRAYCTANPYITCYIEQLGESTLEIELHVNDYEHYNEIIEEIRQKFSKLVRNFQSVLIRKSFFNWMPRDLIT